MVGLGETEDEVLAVMDDLRAAASTSSPSANIFSRPASMRPLTALSRRRNSRPISGIAEEKGFLLVAASPLTRSSYHAGEDFARLKAARLASLGA